MLILVHYFSTLIIQNSIEIYEILLKIVNRTEKIKKLFASLSILANTI